MKPDNQSQNIFLYDGSFTGLLSVMYEIYAQNKLPQNICVKNAQMENFLFGNYEYVETHEDKAEKIISLVCQKLSFTILQRMFYAWLGNDLEKEGKIWRYLAHGLKYGKEFYFNLAHPAVHEVNLIVRKVRREAHRMLGLLRFKKTAEGIFYAPFSPDHNIAMLIAPHFSKRLCDQSWMIHDVSRQIAAIYEGLEGKRDANWFMAEVLWHHEPEVDSEEIYYQKLWKRFHQTIAISERTNLHLQRQFMPQRYWKYLTEMN